jgi:acetyltransferase-like isoleucine patch superfamily enzyme
MLTLNNRIRRAWRIAWTLTSLVAVQICVCGIAALPSVLIWSTLGSVAGTDSFVRLLAFSAAAVPLYVLFALCLIVTMPLVMRIVGWHTPRDAAMRIADLDWNLLGWARYAASIHVVRLLAGTLFRGTPIWTAHLRLAGARLGKRVYVNTLAVSDYNLLEFGDDVVIGDAAHVSGHTVEAGIVKTARVRLGRNVTIGLCSVIEIGVDIGADAQVGAMSFVPKYTRLPGGVVYVGAPVMPVEERNDGHVAGVAPARVAPERPAATVRQP